MSNDITNLQQPMYYSFREVPLLTYGLIGITSVVLATLTILQTDVGQSTEFSNYFQLPTIFPQKEPESTSTFQNIFGGKNKTKKNRPKRK
jgi:hypothetical protein